MSLKRVLIPLYNDEVAPRFDLAREALLVGLDQEAGLENSREILLPQASADGLCDLIVNKDVNVVICGGIEEEYYHYLRWKRVEVVDNVAGLAAAALAKFRQGNLRAGDILFSGGIGHAG